MTKVIVKISGLACTLAALTGLARPQAAAHLAGPAETLYRQLRSVGLDKDRVYAVRNAVLDRGKVHISLDDGTIAFTPDAGGRVTGAFFRGDGEVLLVPPTTAEQASLALSTGAAILEERFSAAYFRFNDDVFSQMKTALHPADDPELFVNVWNASAQTLAEEDALRLLVSFSREAKPGQSDDHLFHAYLEGNKLGAFDVRYDSSLSEPVSAGQHRDVDGAHYYDLWLSFAAPPGGGTPKADSGPPAGPDFDISQFNIHAEIKPPTELTAKAELTIRPRKDGERVLLFELSRLITVTSVEADGQPVEFIHNQAIEGSQLARRGDDVVAVFLGSPLRAGKTTQLRFEYSGAVISQAANGLLYIGEHGTWYPNIGFAMADFDLEFRNPPDWTLIGTGRLTETRTVGGEQISHWISERPVPVAGFNLGKYSSTVTRAGNVTIETYATRNVERGFPEMAEKQPIIPDPLRNRPLPLTPAPPPPSPAQNLQRVGAAAAQALDFYQQKFGPYPYGALALTQFPGPLSQGWPGLVFLSSYCFLTPQELEHVLPDERERLIEHQIVAHEIAHQWWGDLVSWHGYRDQWIMEALANYSALMLLESRNPAEFRAALQKYRDDLLFKNHDGIPLMNAGPVTLGVRLSSSKYPGAYEAIAYGRGTWLFHMLRMMLRDSQAPVGGRNQPGEEPFVRALRWLRNEYEGKTITTAQLMAVFEAELPHSLWYEGHRSLDWFDEGWVNGSAVPRLELRNLKFEDKAGRTGVMGTIIQLDAPETLVTAVPLYASIAGKNVFVGHVFADGAETPFHISAPGRTRKVLLDPEQTILSRAK